MRQAHSWTAGIALPLAISVAVAGIGLVLATHLTLAAKDDLQTRGALVILKKVLAVRGT